MSKRPYIIGVTALVGLGLTTIFIDPPTFVRYLFTGSNESQTATTITQSGIPVGAPIGGAFTLTNQLGQPVTNQTYAGRWMLVFFGYSHCLDECPLTLQKIAITLKALGPMAKRIAPIFITIDPTRDTPPVLDAYLQKFSPDIIGLTGTQDRIAQVAKEYDVAYSNSDHEASGSNAISHSTYMYLLGPDGKFQNLFPINITTTQLTTVLQKALTP